VTVRIEDILQRIRRDIEGAARDGESDATPVDADALPAISSRPELEYLNRNWSLFDPLSEMRSHRRLLGPVVLRFKWMFRRLVLGVLDRYFEKERLLLLELVRFNNALAERSDRLLREVTERTKAVAERNDLFLGALDLRVEALEARQEMARGLESAPRLAASADDRAEELRAEMAAALGGDVGARVRACVQSLTVRGRIVVLGCGTGDVLEELRETSGDLHGVESSDALVRQCRARGFDVELAPLGSALESLEEQSLSGLVVTRVADRHREDEWPALVAGAWRSLRPGGVVVFEGIRDADARLSWLLGRQRFILLGGPEAGGAAPSTADRVLVGRRPEGP
jgi:predicted TPR repeat methyltransferase